MIDVISKPARVSLRSFYVKVTRFLKRYQVSCREIENGLVLSFYAQQNTRYVSKFCVKGGLISESISIRLEMSQKRCQINILSNFS